MPVTSSRFPTISAHDASAGWLRWRPREVLRQTSPSLGFSSLTCLKVKGAPLDSKIAALYSLGSSGIVKDTVIGWDQVQEGRGSLCSKGIYLTAGQDLELSKFRQSLFVCM
jgi:hypothetical protein